MKSKIGFYGGVGSVTGANFLLDTGKAKFLVDCGLIQGERFQSDSNRTTFPYDPAAIDVLLVTHAHADHIGRIPKLVKEGFKGKIYSTEPTRALADVMLRDALEVMIFEESRYGTTRLYDSPDIEGALALWQTVDYGAEIALPDSVTVRFKDAGHILGSAFVVLERGGRKLVFSGDIGNVPQPLMNKPDIPEAYHYLVMESVYGDRSHEEVETRSNLLRHYIEETIRKRGTLIIPAFSLERTQAMVYEINNLVEQRQVPPIDTFLDSPLAIAVTDIYRERSKYLKPEIRRQIENGDNVFEFPRLKLVRSAVESRKIKEKSGPRIIIAGSGMSHGGRILAHEQHFLADKNTTLLLVGYQAVGSLGRKLQDGAAKVKIDNQTVRVRAEIATIRGWSGHADREQLIDFVAKAGDQLEKVFVTMGEERSALFLVQRLRDYLDVNAVAPSAGEVVEIEF